MAIGCSQELTAAIVKGINPVCFLARDRGRVTFVHQVLKNPCAGWVSSSKAVRSPVRAWINREETAWGSMPSNGASSRAGRSINSAYQSTVRHRSGRDCMAVAMSSWSNAFSTVSNVGSSTAPSGLESPSGLACIPSTKFFP